MKNQNLLNSLITSFQGIIFAVRSERNMRLHLAAAFVVIVVSLVLKVEKWELMFVLAAVFLVLITEMINTALERVVDLSTQKYNHLAHAAKNVAAGAVLFAAIFAIAVAGLVFGDRLRFLW